MARFSLDLHELEAANALRSLSEVPETQLSTEKILRQLSSDDSEVMIRKVQGSGEVLHTRPGVYLHKVTVPMARSIREWCGSASTRAPSDWEGYQSTPSTRPHTETRSLHMYHFRVI